MVRGLVTARLQQQGVQHGRLQGSQTFLHCSPDNSLVVLLSILHTVCAQCHDCPVSLCLDCPARATAGCPGTWSPPAPTPPPPPPPASPEAASKITLVRIQLHYMKTNYEREILDTKNTCVKITSKHFTCCKVNARVSVIKKEPI